MGQVKAFKTIAPGPLTTVQDLGRTGFGQYGVAPSGAVDTLSPRVANRLVGNSDDQAGLEITLMGPVLEALNPVAMAVTGANMQPTINHKPVPMWQSIAMKPGDRLSFKGLKDGLRSYLAVGGGICVEPVLKSRSTNLGAGFGGLSGRPLSKGDILLTRFPDAHLKSAGTAFDRIPVYESPQTLRVIDGPRVNHFGESARTLFTKSIYRVSEQSDRTGIRLEGPAIEQKPGLSKSIISEGVVFGAIQIPGDGRPIIILGETVTGGYRQIATVVSADLHFLGQLRPGNRVQFVTVSQDTARKAFEEHQSIIDAII